jgi:photosystem II stability/assembly factor-like uncharacterized protein
MKKLLLSLVLFTSFCSLSAQWNNVSLNSSSDLLRCSFPSDDTGFVISDKIYRTFNGGTSFDSISLPNAVQYWSVDFITNLDGVVAVDIASSGNSIYRTINGGTTWQDISPVPFAGQGMNVKFADALHGTYLTSAPLILNTANGGLSWDTMSFGYDYFGTLDYPTATTGYIGGFDGTFNYSGVIRKTTDGGVTWNLATNFNRSNSMIQQIEFVNADSGFAYFNPYGFDSRIIRTRDGAATWDTVIFTHGTLARIAFSDYMNGFAVNDSGSIYRTSNAGVSWTLDRLQTDYLSDITVTSNFAYAVGNNGLAIKRNLSSGIPVQDYNSTLKIYPNPGADRVNVLLPHGTNVVSVSAMDITGRNCGTISFSYASADEIILDTQKLAKGCYVLEIVSKDETLKVKFEKAR